LSEGFSLSVNTNNPVPDIRTAIHPTPDDVRNDAFVHRQLEADQSFAERAAAIRLQAGIRENIEGIGLEVGVFTLDQPGVEHSNFYAVLIERAGEGAGAAAPGILTIPNTVTSGGEMQMRALALFRDASGETSRDVSTEATWQLSDPSLGVLSPTGLFRAHPGAVGTVDIVARWNDGTHEHSGTFTITVSDVTIDTSATLDIIQ
jgi:hypothetical protein